MLFHKKKGRRADFNGILLSNTQSQNLVLRKLFCMTGQLIQVPVAQRQKSEQTEGLGWSQEESSTTVLEGGHEDVFRDSPLYIRSGIGESLVRSNDSSIERF